MPNPILTGAAAILVLLPPTSAAFVPPTFLRTVPPPPAAAAADGRASPSSLLMGKSMTVPGPSGSGSSGPAASEYRQKKMRDRLKGKKKKKKKGGGFSGGDDDGDDGAAAGGGGPVMEIELEAEPGGGEEVAPLAAPDGGGGSGGAPAVRLKDMGPVDGSDPAYGLKEKLGAEVRNFWLTAVADGGAIRKTRNVVLRDASRNADFPGFRKGQIPPYAQPKMTSFALREVIVTSCQDAIKLFGVQEINEDDLGAVTFNEDVQAIAGKYDIKVCPSVPFTANFRAIYDPEITRKPPASAVETEKTEEEVAE